MKGKGGIDKPCSTQNVSIIFATSAMALRLAMASFSEETKKGAKDGSSLTLIGHMLLDNTWWRTSTPEEKTKAENINKK